MENLDGVAYPSGCDTPAIRQSLRDWLAYRRRIGKPYRDPAQQLTLLLRRYGPRVIEAVEYSIAQGYQGAFLPCDGPREKPRKPTVDELIAEAAKGPVSPLLSHWLEEPPSRAGPANGAPSR